MRLSGRLKESAARLVADAGAMTAHLERLMQQLGRGNDLGASKRVLELNGEHPAVVALRHLYEKAPHWTRALRTTAGCCTTRR